MLFRRLSPFLDGRAVGGQGHPPMQGVFAPPGGLIEGKTAEGHRGGELYDQVHIGLQEQGGVGQHVAVQKQQPAAARGLGQAVAALGAPQIGQGPHEADRQGRALRGGLDPVRQKVVARAVVEQHHFDGPAMGADLALQGGDQAAGVVAEKGDQHRQGRGGARPVRIVGDGFTDLGHASLACKARATSSDRPRTSATSSNRARAP